MRNLNRFTLSGRVMRAIVGEATTFVVLGNNQDYKDKEGDWQNVAYYLPITFFRVMDVQEGDFVTISGTVSTRMDQNDEKKSVLSLIGNEIDNFTIMTGARESSGGGNKSKKSSAPAKKSDNKTKVAASVKSVPKSKSAKSTDEDLSSLWDDEEEE